MNSVKYAPRLLGAAFLFVVFASLTSGLLLSSAVGSGGISDMLVNIANRPTLLRISILLEMVNSSGIIVLASLLYVVLNRQNKMLARIALGWWLGEALILGLTSTATLALIPLSLDFVKAGAPQNSFYQALGGLLYYGVYRHGYFGIHMWFYCIGGMLWYYMFYQSRYIPRIISLWGLVAVSLASLAVVLQFLGYDAPMLLSLPVLPFELTIGTWLALRGIRDASETKQPLVRANETILVQQG